MRGVVAVRMAQCLQQVASPAVARSLPISRNGIASVSSSTASPLLAPWWRGMMSAFPRAALSCNVEPFSRVASGSRRLSIAAQAAADAAAEPVPEAALPAEESSGVAEPDSPIKTKALTKRVQHIMSLLNEELVDKARQVKEFPDFRPGDVLQLRVEVPENKRRVSIIKGVVIARKNAGINSTFRIRRIMAGVGVEFVFPLYSPNIKEIVVLTKGKIPARRAKLYYLREKNPRLCAV
eukprot:TRINITY_DN14196_c0_g2_i1.p1 TRINITY_DN14196_c0_g2~~TRINITY_DN14196_c0_g2_i1.p1  ORF type:complete len:237 (-),score=48.61 TRINITY_DN14196_c0_g2_i1:890-1600(-)